MVENAITKTIDDLRNCGKLTGVDVANIADVSKATVFRWTTGKATPHPKTQLVLSDLHYIIDRIDITAQLRFVEAKDINWPA